MTSGRGESERDSWIIRYADTNGENRELTVSVDESHRVLLRRPEDRNGDSLPWRDALTLIAALNSAVMAILRGQQI